MMHLAGCAAVKKERLSLNMQPAKSSYSAHEPYIVEYAITNKDAAPIRVDTGYYGVRKFYFHSGHKKYLTNQSYPLGGMDFGKRQFLLKPHETLRLCLAVNGWVDFDPGRHKVTGVFETNSGTIKSTFLIQVTNSILSPETILESWYAYYKMHHFNEVQRDQLMECLASVCTRAPKLKETLAVLKNSRQPEQSKFYSDVVFYTQQSWDAID